MPSNLSADDLLLRPDLVNTATFSAMSGARPLSIWSTATIGVDNPVAIDVLPAKSRSPEGQSYQPGATSNIVIGATQASNVNAGSIRLHNPASPRSRPMGDDAASSEPRYRKL